MDSCDTINGRVILDLCDLESCLRFKEDFWLKEEMKSQMRIITINEYRMKRNESLTNKQRNDLDEMKQNLPSSSEWKEKSLMLYPFLKHPVISRMYLSPSTTMLLKKSMTEFSFDDVEVNADQLRILPTFL